MCLTEVWTYSECGCRFDNRVPCHSSFDQNPSTPSPSMKRNPALDWFEYQSSLIHFPPPPSSTDSEPGFEIDVPLAFNHSAYLGACSIYHTVHKQFLEPVCDDCILEELGLDESGHTTRNNIAEMAGDKGLVWDSNVDIEIGNVVGKNSTKEEDDRRIYDSNVEIQIEEDTVIAANTETDSIPPSSVRISTNDDADDEGSLFIRGRPRSRTKEIRKHGMDISRDSLRVPSRYPSGEKRAMEDFRNNLQRPLSPTKTLLHKFALAQSQSHVWARNVMKSLNGSISRSRGRSTKMKNASTQTSDEFQTIDTPQSTRRTVQRVTSGISTDDELSSTAISSTSGIIETYYSSSRDVSDSTVAQGAVPSWHEHLHHDLAPRRKHKQHRVDESNEVSPTSSEPETRLPRGSKADLCYEDDHQAHQPLLFHAPSISMTASSISTSASWPRLAERLSSMVTSTKVDHTTWEEDGDEGTNCTTTSSSNAMADSRAFATVSTAHTTHRHNPSIDSKITFISDSPQRTMPRRVSSMSCHASPCKNPASATRGMLSIHPLKTGLQISTPSRPSFTQRTSSLFGSPLATRLVQEGPEATDTAPQ